MADQRPWVKLWKSWLRDPDIARLSLADQARWIWLLLLVADNGDGGQWYLRGGGGDLPPRWRLGLGSGGVRDALSRLPGIEVRDDEWPSPGITVTFVKWSKYQTDSSAERTKRWREKRSHRDATPPSPPPNRVTVQEVDVEEKRIPLTPLRDNGHPKPPAAKVTPGWSDPHDSTDLRIPD